MINKVFTNIFFILKGTWSSITSVEKFNPYNRGKRGGMDMAWYNLLIPPLARLIFDNLRVLFNFIFKSEVKYIPLKEITSAFDHLFTSKIQMDIKSIEALTKSEYPAYDFNSLIESLDKKGITGFIVVWDKLDTSEKYKIKDGNHRVAALKVLHDPEYKIKVLIYNKVK